MAKVSFGRWHFLFGLLLGLATSAPSARAAEPAPPAGVAVEAHWVRLPRLYGRITARELGLVINTADPYSVAVGEYYARRRGIAAEQVVRVQLPVRASLTRDEFAALEQAIRSQMPEHVNGLALAWVQPYAVDCNALTGALGIGLQPEMCASSCAATRVSPYPAYSGSRPWPVLGMRPAMQLAARSVASAMAMIERGMAADH